MPGCFDRGVTLEAGITGRRCCGRRSTHAGGRAWGALAARGVGPSLRSGGMRVTLIAPTGGLAPAGSDGEGG